MAIWRSMRAICSIEASLYSLLTGGALTDGFGTDSSGIAAVEGCEEACEGVGTDAGDALAIEGPVWVIDWGMA